MSEQTPIAPAEAYPTSYEKKAGARNARKPLTELDDKARKLLEYTVWGCPDEDLCAEHGFTPGVPLSLENACDLIPTLRRRNARFITTQKVYVEALNAELAAMRNGAKPAALRKVVEIMNDPGEGTAADRTVALKAATALLGDSVGAPPANAPPVSVSIGVQLQPGVVIRLPADVGPTPLETQQKTIEMQATRVPMRTSDADAQQRYLPDDEEDAA